MERTEIIKALEHWSKNFDGKVTDFATLCQAILLINELTAENERLREELEQRPPKLIITKISKKGE